MRISLQTAHLGSFHAKRLVALFFQLVNWFGKCRPAAARIKLVQRRKQRLTTHNIDIDAFFEKLIIFAGKWRFGSSLLRNAVLHFSQLVFISQRNPSFRTC